MVILRNNDYDGGTFQKNNLPEIKSTNTMIRVKYNSCTGHTKKTNRRNFDSEQNKK